MITYTGKGKSRATVFFGLSECNILRLSLLQNLGRILVIQHKGDFYPSVSPSVLPGSFPLPLLPFVDIAWMGWSDTGSFIGFVKKWSNYDYSTHVVTLLRALHIMLLLWL